MWITTTGKIVMLISVDSILVRYDQGLKFNLIGSKKSSDKLLYVVNVRTFIPEITASFLWRTGLLSRLSFQNPHDTHIFKNDSRY